MVKGTELVQKLIRGSENIDRMKKDIERVITIILGLLSMSSTLRESLYSFNNFGYCWDIQSTSVGWSVSCRILESGSEVCRFLSSPRGGNTNFVSLENVKSVHQGLKVLVVGFNQFPEIKKGLQPLLDAADYKF